MGRGELLPDLYIQAKERLRACFLELDSLPDMNEFKKMDRPGGTGVAEQSAVSSAEKKRRKNHE
jgi:hypothetical protein